MEHKSWIKNYESDFERLAEEIGDLRYDSIADFLLLLSQKIEKDGGKDRARGRVKLANALDETAKHLKEGSESVMDAWRICESYMFPKDIFDRVKDDFKKEEQKEAFAILSKFCKNWSGDNYNYNFRLARCLVFVSKGDISKMSDYIKMASEDPRDLISEAEYDHEMNWLRTFYRPFGQGKITQRDLEDNELEESVDDDDLPF